MILKRIRLKNIRSYKDAEITFPRGSVLLSGDIGCGKTSVLLAIEFALFGLQPGQKGASLLRSNEKEGRVSLELEIDGKEILIERTLKRGKTISQEEAYITIDNEKKEMAVSELKNLILSLLDYPSEFIKKSNLLYRFTVYTPQEEMKQIILESVETRLDTLRHVFGIDKYKRIKENSEILRISLREEIKTKQGMILDIDVKKIRKSQKLSEIEQLKSSAAETERELFQFIEKRKNAESSVKETADKIDEKRKIEHEIDKTKVLLAGKKEMFSSLVREQEKIKQQIEESSKISFNENELIALGKKKEDLRKKLDSLNSSNLEISSQISSLNLKNSENEKLKNTISRIDLCPTCLQNVDSSYKANITNKIESETSANKNLILNLTAERNKIASGIEELSRNIRELESGISEMNFSKIKIEALNEKKARFSEIESQKSSMEKDFEMLEKHAENLKSVSFELSRYELIHKTREIELEQARKNERASEIKLSSIKKEIELINKEIAELEKEISDKEKIKEALNYLASLQDWLASTFLELISFTEKNVMFKLRDEFSKLFNEWFNILVPEIFTVRLDDSFTPIIEQSDYELDYGFLSGGERTAIALAYRLALNQTINSLLSKIKTKDIVILDEPTDGFSEQQLDKMRDVLSQLKVKQLILVSHESKIESFVENVIKFRKESGVTKVEV